MRSSNHRLPCLLHCVVGPVVGAFMKKLAQNSTKKWSLLPAGVFTTPSGCRLSTTHTRNSEAARARRKHRTYTIVPCTLLEEIRGQASALPSYERIMNAICSSATAVEVGPLLGTGLCVTVPGRVDLNLPLGAVIPATVRDAGRCRGL